MKILTLFMAWNLAQAAIFGTDNRRPLYSFEPQNILGRATAIALLTGNSEIHPEQKQLNIDANSLSGTLCEDQKFSKDLSLSYSCTGFLIAPDLLVTAGHCLSNHEEVRDESGGYCEVYAWLFDYQATPTSQPQTQGISTDHLYHCKRILYAVLDEQAPFRDYGLVQLDRPVLDRQPLKIASAPIEKGHSVYMLGYPLGTPLKITDSAKVILNNPNEKSFVTNLDAFEGNSGSPVLNSKNEVVGILVSGTPEMSLIKDEVRGCYRYNQCDENGLHCVKPDLDPSRIAGFQTTGSDVQRITPLIELLQQQEKK